MPMPTDSLISEFERLIRRDPGGRGLLGPNADVGLGLGELGRAAARLAETPGAVGIVTGFFIPTATDGGASEPRGFAETDGPLGSALLAAVLQKLNRDVRVITDENCGAVVRTALQAQGLDPELALVAPLQSQDWRHEFWTSSFGQACRTLIAIERVGPSHTRQSLERAGSTASILDDFERSVPSSDRGHCFNMRGLNIDAFTGDLHVLFEEFASRSCGLTLGVGDGGNEIGMGRFPWHELRSRLPETVGAKIPCRIAADRTVLAGTSNWGAYALAASVAVRAGRIDLLEPHTGAEQLRCLESIVHESMAVDGVTRRHEATVDGLPFLTYIQPWLGIRKLLGLPD